MSRRATAFAALAAVVVAYYYGRTSLPQLSYWWTIGVLVFPVIPGVLALVWLALPLRNALAPLHIGLAFALLAYVFDRADLAIEGNFCKLFAPVFIGWWFLRWFENVWWVVIVACLIPVVDIYSVFWGPTQTITQHHPSVYFGIAFAFAAPHGGAAHVGPPDLLFFALFLGAADQFRLRVPLTFALTSFSFGATMLLANALHIDGLPALPFLSAGFLLANADLLWRRRGEVLH